MKEDDLSKKIYAAAIECGFDNCGIVSVDAVDGFKEFYQKRVDDIPQSKFFYDSTGNLQGTKERFPWAESIIILSFDYGKYRYPEEFFGKYATAFFLHPKEETEFGFKAQRFEKWLAENEIRAEGGEHFSYLSVGPLRYIAAQAGLGIIRKNNFLYTKTGSYNLLLGYAIDKKCELIQSVNLAPCAEKCDLCRRACKTKALQGANAMNPLKCVSFLTTFGNSGVPDGLSLEMFEEWVCGCDNCQNACPHNKRHDWSKGKEFKGLEELAHALSPQNYDNLSDEFLIEQVVSRTDEHLQPSDVQSLRNNAKRAAEYQKKKQV